MKNTLNDLQNILFEQLERLQDDEELKDEEKFDREIRRSQEVSKIASVIINGGTLALRAAKYAAEYNKPAPVPLLGEVSDGKAQRHTG